MAMSKTEHVRRILEKNFDLPADEVQARLERKGIEVEIGLVYNTRSVMRKERNVEEELQQLEEEESRQRIEEEKQQAQQQAEAKLAKRKATAAKVQQTKSLNAKPLQEHILLALSNSSTGLTAAETAQRCIAGGYITSGESENFAYTVRRNLRLAVWQYWLVRCVKLVMRFLFPSQLLLTRLMGSLSW